MQKTTYYLLKVILPDLLFTILLILLFDILNFNVEIIESKYVILFALSFTVLNYISKRMFDLIQIHYMKKISLTEMLKNNKMMIVFPIISILLNIFSIIYFVFCSMIYSEHIMFSDIYITLIIAISVVILKIILNKVMNFDRIIINSGLQKDIDEKYNTMLEEILNEEEINKIEDPKEKDEEIKRRLEEVFKQILEEKKDDDKKE